MDSGPLVELSGISVTRGGETILDRLSLRLAAGEKLVVLGEAGAGKDALLRVLGGFAGRGDIVTGTIRYGAGKPLHASAYMRSPIRMAYLPNPLSGPLAPHGNVLKQLTRVVSRKLRAPTGSARADLRLALEQLPGGVTLEMLDTTPERLDPLTQAIGLLACVLAQTPELVLANSAVADLGPKAVKLLLEALDVAQKRLGFALVFATGGLQPAARLGGRVLVLRGGRMVEEGSAERLMSGNAHSYTRRLFESLPRLKTGVPKARGATRGQPLLQVHNLAFGGEAAGRDGLTFELRKGAALALVGEPGSGREALLRVMLGFDPAPKGCVLFDAVDLNVLSVAMAARIRRRIAFITGRDDTLDPRMTLWDTVDEPLRAHLNLSGELIAGYRDTALKRVGLASHSGMRRVASLSAFDKRRLQVARAIVGAPLLVVVDEAMAGLDAYAQSILREVLIDFRKHQDPTFLVVTSDFTVAQALAEDAMVFEAGKLVERGSIAHLVHAPRHDATKALIDAVLLPSLAGDGLSPGEPSV